MTASPIVPRSLSASSIAAHSVRFHQSGTFFRLACPAHGDAGLSLAIWDLPEGGIGARCFTHGCSDHEIAQALGLPEPESARYQCPVPGRRLPFARRLPHGNLHARGRVCRRGTSSRKSRFGPCAEAPSPGDVDVPVPGECGDAACRLLKRPTSSCRYGDGS